MIYYTAYVEGMRNSAGSKAPSDIKQLCEQRGYTLAKVLPPPNNMPEVMQKAWKLNYCRRFWKKLESTMCEGDVLIYQHPMYIIKAFANKSIPVLKNKGVKLIALIHDLETLRQGIEGLIDNTSGHADENAEKILLKEFDIVICHNFRMMDYLINEGFSPNQLVCLEIFDYLSDIIVPDRIKSSIPSIAIAGTLHKGKCGYIYNIIDSTHNGSLKVNLFGNYFDESSESEQMVYHGSFPPAELPKYLVGDFGLVWDGQSAETCSGNTGEYLRYNNPHKCSLYLSSKLPVIVWSQSAIAKFVDDNHVGIKVNSLHDLQEAILSVNDEEYMEMIKNTAVVSERLHSGYYFYSALDKALDRLSVDQNK